jgi:hypothetical protein
VLAKDLDDYTKISQHFEQNLSYFTFYSKSEKPVKAVIRPLPSDTPAEDIANGLRSLGFTVISVRQMTTTRRMTGGGSEVTNLP